MSLPSYEEMLAMDDASCGHNQELNYLREHVALTDEQFKQMSAEHARVVAERDALRRELGIQKMLDRDDRLVEAERVLELMASERDNALMALAELQGEYREMVSLLQAHERGDRVSRNHRDVHYIENDVIDAGCECAAPFDGHEGFCPARCLQ